MIFKIEYGMTVSEEEIRKLQTYNQKGIYRLVEAGLKQLRKWAATTQRAKFLSRDLLYKEALIKNKDE